MAHPTNTHHSFNSEFVTISHTALISYSSLVNVPLKKLLKDEKPTVQFNIQNKSSGNDKKISPASKLLGLFHNKSDKQILRHTKKSKTKQIEINW
jgi:hypothetical protein